ncbi:MAG TPA: helicase-related protein, partial [Xanthomonadales bacterium]|nr:helicase-related protein [Xanthomonadales bacterium]
KRELLSHMIGQGNWQQVLVFTRTKHGANKLCKQLEQDGLSAAAIHGNKSQAARQRALNEFKQGDIRVLVATDVAARGLDIELLPHVVNYDLPNVPEDYVHRIGRTARAGQQGHAISLVCVDEKDMLRDIETLLQQRLEKIVLAGYEPDPSIKAEPIKQGGRSNGRSHSRPDHKQPRRQQSGQARGQSRGQSRGNAGSQSAKRNGANGKAAQTTQAARSDQRGDAKRRGQGGNSSRGQSNASTASSRTGRPLADRAWSR